jgi:hypothetical protein
MTQTDAVGVPLKNRFTKYRFRRGEQVIVNGNFFIDDVCMPWEAVVVEPPSKEFDGEMIVVAIYPNGGSSTWRVTPFNHPKIREMLGKGKAHQPTVATPKFYPSMDDDGNPIERRDAYTPFCSCKDEEESTDDEEF